MQFLPLFFENKKKGNVDYGGEQRRVAAAEVIVGGGSGGWARLIGPGD